MTTNPHLDSAIAFFGAPVDSADVVVVLLHGRAQSPEYMQRNVAERIDLPGVAYVAPAAANGTWYPASFMAELSENEPMLGFALARVGRLCDGLARDGKPLAKQVIMGFSQGACLACEFVRRWRQRFAALIAFTGGLIGPPGTAWTVEGGGTYGAMPVLLGGSDVDPWVPAERMSATADWFQRLDARVSLSFFSGMGHLIADEQIAEAREILREVGQRRTHRRG